MQQLGHPQSHGGLAGARSPGEAHVQVRAGCGKAKPLPRPVDQQQRRDLVYPLFHGHKTDEVAVEGEEHIVDTRGLTFGGEADGRMRRQLLARLHGPAIPLRPPPGTGHRPQPLPRSRDRAHCRCR